MLYAKDTMSIKNLLQSEFIPWCLFMSDNNKVRRIFRQPELQKLLQSLPEATPLIKDLDILLSEMEH